MWRHLLAKFASYRVLPVMVSTHGSVVPLAMFLVCKGVVNAAAVNELLVSPGCLTGVSHMSPRCLRGVSRVSPGCLALPGVSSPRCLMLPGEPQVSTWCLPDVSQVSPRCLPVVSQVFPTCLPGDFCSQVSPM